MKTTFARPRPQRFPVGTALYLLLVALLVAVDQLIKLVVFNTMRYQDIPVLGNFIHLYYCENTGAAFSLMPGKTWLLIGATVIMVAVCLVLLVRRTFDGRAGNFALVLVSAGGIGNLIDRIFRHYVIDYIYPKFINFAIFNFADCCVVVGAFLLCFYLVLHEKQTEQRGLFR